MAYKALYRTYRPQNFSEVYGQYAIVKTLKNSIINNKISHAYLFSGPRGIGKTSIARIFAKALNCTNVVQGEPCCKCETCLEIANNSYPDVIEIDAASNNGVDEIREIRDKVKFLPVGAKFKIYIIDEVHMLSTGAFNALLKTLEEPPKHAIFILATTEAYKIPSTIISRCQCYEFRGLSTKEIVDNLTEIAQKENLKITEESLTAIAEASEGGMRDALSLLDQVISYSNDDINIDAVNEITGNLNNDMILQMASALEKKDTTNSIKMLNELISSGKEETKIVGSLIQFYRDILIYKNIHDESYTKQIFAKPEFSELATKLNDDEIFYYVDVLSDVQNKIKYSSTPHVFLEISMIKIINAGADMIHLSNRLNAIEEKINNIKMASPAGGTQVDNSKIAVLESKVSKVVTQLNQMELPKFIDKVKTLEINQTQIVKPTTDYESEITNIQEELLVLKTNYNALSNVANQGSGVDLTEINEKIEKCNQRIDQLSKNNNAELMVEFKGKISEIENLKKSIFEHKYSDPVEYDLTEIKNKIINIENKLYKYIATILSTETLPIKKTKSKLSETLGVNEEGIFSLAKTLPEQKVKVDFEDISKPVEIKLEVVEEEKPTVGEIQSETVNPFLVVETQTPLEVPKAGVLVTETEEGTIISKPNSNLFIKNQIVEEIQEKKPEPINVEEPVRDLFFEEAQELDKHLETLKEPQVEVPDEYSEYNVKVLERIMYDASLKDSLNDKKRITKIWETILSNADPDRSNIAELLHQGKIVAVGNKEFVIVYPDSAMCNLVMRIRFKQESLKFLYDILGDSYNYLALPINVWEEKREEYRVQYYTGTKHPKLTPFNDATLRILKDDQEFLDQSEKAINNVVEMFGELVTIDRSKK